MKVLVCGGRDFNRKSVVDYVLTLIDSDTPIDTVIHGDARGADALAGEWAREHGKEEIPFPADWKKHGKAAGQIRNKEMLEYTIPDMVIAFPGGRGTKNMIDLAQEQGYNVKIIHLHEMANDEKDPSS